MNLTQLFCQTLLTTVSALCNELVTGKKAEQKNSREEVVVKYFKDAATLIAISVLFKNFFFVLFVALIISSSGAIFAYEYENSQLLKAFVKLSILFILLLGFSLTAFHSNLKKYKKGNKNDSE
jgi:hypothetical protein